MGHSRGSHSMLGNYYSPDQGYWATICQHANQNAPWLPSCFICQTHQEHIVSINEQELARREKFSLICPLARISPLLPVYPRSVWGLKTTYKTYDRLRFNSNGDRDKCWPWALSFTVKLPMSSISTMKKSSLLHGTLFWHRSKDIY